MQSTPEARPGPAGPAGPGGPGAAAGRAESDTRPNVVMMVVDDMRVDELRYMPRTRRLLADRGVQFANSFAPYPLCCPARASYFTGQYTHNHRVFNVHEPYAFPALKDDATIATWLRTEGYHTTLLGKYMNGYGYMPEPGRTTGKSLRYKPPGWSSWRASFEGGIPKEHPASGSTYLYFDTTLSRNGEGFVNYEGRYQTDVYAELSEKIIERRAAAEKPFFLYVGYAAPHNGGGEPGDPKYVEGTDGLAKFGTPARPDRVKGIFDEDIADAPGAGWFDPTPGDKPEYLLRRSTPNQAELDAMRSLARQRAEALHVVDQAVRRTVRALATAGELENTLIIFTSDNGYFLGEQHIRQGKILPHEPSLRTTTLMRGPSIPEGETRYDPLMSIDFAPTIAEVTGAEPTIPVDGRSVLDVVRNGDEGWERAVLTETGPRSVVRNTDESGEPLNVEDPGQQDLRWAIGLRTPRYLYVDLATGEDELYDVVTDPEQTDNLARDPQNESLVASMREELRRLRACDGTEQCSEPLPPPLRAGPPVAGLIPDGVHPGPGPGARR